jgi:hypothetical protein
MRRAQQHRRKLRFSKPRRWRKWLHNVARLRAGAIMAVAAAEKMAMFFRGARK